MLFLTYFFIHSISESAEQRNACAVHNHLTPVAGFSHTPKKQWSHSLAVGGGGDAAACAHHAHCMLYMQFYGEGIARAARARMAT